MQKIRNETGLIKLAVVHYLNRRLEMGLSVACLEMTYLDTFGGITKGFYKIDNKNPNFLHNLRNIPEFLFK